MYSIYIIITEFPVIWVGNLPVSRLELHERDSVFKEHGAVTRTREASKVHCGSK